VNGLPGASEKHKADREQVDGIAVLDADGLVRYVSLPRRIQVSVEEHAGELIHLFHRRARKSQAALGQLLQNPETMGSIRALHEDLLALAGLTFVNF
jgi:hypothetical protein